MQGKTFEIDYPRGAVPSKLIGIYRIFCRENQKSYVGKTEGQAGFAQRWSGHRGDLRRGAHGCYHLQFAYNKYGEKSFCFEVLEVCERTDDLSWKEWEWMQKLDALENGFNLKGYRQDESGRLKELMKNINARHFEFISPSGEMVIGYNLSKFCRENNLEKRCMSEVLRGSQYSHQGYISTNLAFNKPSAIEYRFLSINNELITITDIPLFVKENGLNDTAFRDMLKGRISHHKGWHLENMSEKHKNNFKVFFDFIPNNVEEQSISKRNKNSPSDSLKRLVSPNGKIVEFTNAKIFCNEYHFKLRSLSNLLCGNINSYKGWRLAEPISSQDFSLFIQKIDMNTGEVLEIYSSFKLATLSVIDEYPFAIPASLYKCVDGKIKSSYGFHWKLGESLNDFAPVNLSIFKKRSKWDRVN
jgi:hypothetical protein